jgi:hypothetical protein
MSRISYRLEDVNVFNPDDWAKIQKFLINSMINVSDVFKKYIVQIKQY